MVAHLTERPSPRTSAGLVGSLGVVLAGIALSRAATTASPGVPALVVTGLCAAVVVVAAGGLAVHRVGGRLGGRAFGWCVAGAFLGGLVLWVATAFTGTPGTPAVTDLSTAASVGAAAGVGVAGVDVARTRAHDAARQRERQLRLTLSNVRDYAIVQLNTDGTVTGWNEGARRTLGYEADAVLGDRLDRIYPEDANETTVRLLQQALRDGRVVSEGTRVRADGSHFLAKEVVTALYDEGELTGFVVGVQDMTWHAEREREEVKAHQDARIEQVASVVGRDLRDPLERTRAAIDEAQTGNTERLETARTELDQAVRFLERLPVLVRAGRDVERLDRVDVREAAEAARADVDAMWLTLDIADDLVVSGDRERVELLFETLFQSAVDRGGADVTVTVDALGDDCLRVTDDAPVFPPGVRERGGRYGYERYAGVSGDDLAVPLVHAIAEAHGWTVEMTGDGEHTRFEFCGVDRLYR